MFIEAVDESAGLVLWLFTGRTNSDEDFQAYCDSIERIALFDCDGWKFSVLIVDSGNPMPTARWRREIANVSRKMPDRSAFILVGSPLARGVATAVNWIRPPTYLLRTAPSFIDATRIAEEIGGKPLPRLRELHEELRARSVARAAI